MSKILTGLVSFFRLAILTNFLVKEDFGLIAIANIFIGFASLFADVGFNIGIIHKQKISRETLSSLFWFGLACGLFLSICLCLASYPVSWYYNDYSLVSIISLLSLSVFFNSLGSQSVTMFQKNHKFKIISVITIISTILSFCCAVLMAYLGYGVYSIVFAVLVQSLLYSMTFLVLNIKTYNSIYFHYKYNEIKPFLNIGLYQIGSNIFDYSNKQLDIFIISTFYSKEVVGVYSLCKNFVLMIYSTTGSVFNTLLAPYFADIQTQKEKVKSIFLNIVNFNFIVFFPMYILLAYFADYIILLVFGENYLEGAPILSLLLIGYAFVNIMIIVAPLVVAYGRTNLFMLWNFYLLLTNSIMLYFVSGFEIVYIAVYFAVFSIINTYMYWWFVVRKIININYLDFMKNPLLIAFQSFLCVIPLYLLISDDFVQMILSSLIFLTAYYFIIKRQLIENIIFNNLTSKFLKNG